MLVGSYFCTYISYLLDFDIDNMVSFDTKYFFLKVNFNLPNTLKEAQDTNHNEDAPLLYMGKMYAFFLTIYQSTKSTARKLSLVCKQWL